jgi:hypothetical protein
MLVHLNGRIPGPRIRRSGVCLDIAATARGEKGGGLARHGQA